MPEETAAGLIIEACQDKISESFFVKNRLFLRLMLLSVCNSLAIGVVNATMNIYAVYLGANSSQIGLIGGIAGLGIVMTVLPVGFFIDRWGAKKMYFIGGLCGALIFFLISFVATAALLIAACAISSLFMSSRFVSMNSVFFEQLKIVGNEKGGWYRGSQAIGFALLGPLLGVYLIKVIGFGLTFRIASLFLLIAVWVAAFALKENIKEQDRSEFMFRDVFSHIEALLKNRDLVEASLSEAMAIASTTCFNTFIVVIVLRTFHLTREVAALFLAIQGIVYVLTVFSLDKLLIRLGVRKFYFWGIAAIVFGLLFLGSAGIPLVLWAGTVLMGIGAGMFTIVNMYRVAHINIKKGKLAGFYTLLISFGSFLGPIAGGAVGSIFGYQSIFLALIPLFIFFGFRVYVRNSRREEREYAVTE